MSLIDIILTIIIQVLFCLGLRTILSEGQILHFIREPFEYEKDSKIMNFLRNRLRDRVLISTENVYATRKKYQNISYKLAIFLKPILLCVICFASIWGGFVFIALHGLQWQIIICCISSTFLLKIINDHVEF